jgi:hypothetical protein
MVVLPIRRNQSGGVNMSGGNTDAKRTPKADNAIRRIAIPLNASGPLPCNRRQIGKSAVLTPKRTPSIKKLPKVLPPVPRSVMIANVVIQKTPGITGTIKSTGFHDTLIHPNSQNIEQAPIALGR